MKASKYLNSNLIMGSFAVALLGGLPLAAANAEDGSQSLRAMHDKRSFQDNNVVSEPATSVDKEEHYMMAKDDSGHIRKFPERRKVPYPKARGR